MLFLSNSVQVVFRLNLLAGFFISNYCYLKDTSIGGNFEYQTQLKNNKCLRARIDVDVMR
jgi:hypothetical protein